MLRYWPEWDGVSFIILPKILLIFVTRKTTTMLFKMLGIERAYAQQSEGSSIARPRQVFVTQSRVLATRVEEVFSKLMASLAATNKSIEELEELAKQQKVQKAENSGLYDINDDVTWKASLPKKFSLLQDEHFPLFLTFDRVRVPVLSLVASFLTNYCSFANC
jgi:hypothetical protein